MFGFIELDANKIKNGLIGFSSFTATSGDDESNYKDSNVISFTDTGHVRNGNYATFTNSSTVYTFLSHTATAFGMLLDLDASTPTYKIF